MRRVRSLAGGRPLAESREPDSSVASVHGGVRIPPYRHEDTNRLWCDFPSKMPAIREPAQASMRGTTRQSPRGLASQEAIYDRI